MNEDRLNELLERCESPIECKLLKNLYPHLRTDRARELRAQHTIDKYPELVTIPDFAFPDMQIAIYCDGFALREGDRNAFWKDRFQSRELQLKGWIVLRFTGSEINRNEMVVDTIQRAIARRGRQRKWGRLYLHSDRQTQQKTWTKRDKRLAGDLELHSGRQPWTQQKTEGGMCGVIFLASIIVGVLVLLEFIF